MIVNAGYRGKVGASAPKFTYTGNYNVREDGVVELLTSGTLVFLNPAVIDVFCVGGGGAGGTRYAGDTSRIGFGGGGGGYTATLRQVTVRGSYAITIGEGGQYPSGAAARVDGTATTFANLLTAKGGSGKAYEASLATRRAGGAGGSGGGGGVDSSSDYGAGGSDGAGGERGTYGGGGNGQGTTTREFGDPDGKLYAGGGGGGRYLYSNSAVISPGGSGGGGAGGWRTIGDNQPAGAGGANTGGGGGGGAVADGTDIARPGTGGSGICCFRAAK